MNYFVTGYLNHLKIQISHFPKRECHDKPNISNSMFRFVYRCYSNADRFPNYGQKKRIR